MSRMKTTQLLILLLAAMGICAPAQESPEPVDCSTRHLKHKVSCLCGEVAVCSGDICVGPSVFDLDDNLDAVLRDEHGRILDSRTLFYKTQRKFCFEGRRDGGYQIAFVLYKKGAPRPAVVFPTNYKQKRTKRCDAIYMVEPDCPK
jgi:hypothetical protein